MEGLKNNVKEHNKIEDITKEIQELEDKLELDVNKQEDRIKNAEMHHNTAKNYFQSIFETLSNNN